MAVQLANILAVRLSPYEPGQVLPWNGVQIEDGWRSVMTVSDIMAKVQTTVYFGNSLYMISYDIGQLSRQDGFTAFLKPYYGRNMMFAQLSQPPYAAVPARYRALISMPPAPPPVATGTMSIVSSGFDPFRGYWIEFAGNYFLTASIFKGWPNVFRDGPNYSGFQASAFNPGPGGNTGTGNQGGNQGNC
jgi:hypothetical protein